MTELARADLVDILETIKKDIFYSLNCHRVGIINSFNTENQTATIQLVDKITKNTNDKELLTLSPLINCPVVIFGGQSGGITIPINEGDTCLVCFNDRSLDKWFNDGNIQKPITARAHDMSDAIAIVGLRNNINAIANYDNEQTQVYYQDESLSLKDGNAVLSTSAGSSVDLDSKVGISNSSSDLKTLLEAVVTVINTLNGQGGMTGAPIIVDSSPIVTEINNLLK